MQIAFVPFCSQQCKLTNKFRISSDSGVKMYAALCRVLGDSATLILPPEKQCLDSVEGCNIVRSPETYLSNLDRKLHWNPTWLDTLGRLCDVLVTTNEFLPIPMRALHPDLPIVVEGIVSTAWHEVDELYSVAQRCATLVHCNNEQVARKCEGNRVLWPFGFEDSFLSLRERKSKSVDVLFNSRCSATGYTHHEEFIEAIRNRGLRVLMTDPTGYLRKTDRVPPYFQLGAQDYDVALAESRVVVCLVDNGYVPTSFLEAVAAGCCPVCPAYSQYVDLLGDAAFYVEGDGGVFPAVRRALVAGAPSVPAYRLRGVSYSAACEIAKEHLWRLSR